MHVLQAQAAIRRGRAAREKELLDLISQEQEIDKLLESAQRKLRQSQQALKALGQEYGEASSRVVWYEHINLQFEKRFSTLGTAKFFGRFAAGVFVFGFLTGLLLLRQVALAISIGVAFVVACYPLLRLMPLLVFVLGLLAEWIGNDRRSKTLFSLRGFAVAFCPLLIAQEVNFMVPPVSPSWANVLLALILALGGGVAGGFSRAIGDAVGRLTKAHFKAVVVVCQCIVPLLVLAQSVK